MTPPCIYPFEGMIWQLITDPAARLLVVEVRHAQKQQVSFAAIDLTSDHLLWKDIVFEERWWISAATTDGQTLMLQTYLEQENPQHKHFFAIDVPTRQIRWQSDTFQVMHVDQGWLTGYEPVGETRRYQKIRLADQTIHPWSIAEAKLLPDEKNKNLRHPFHYPETNAYFENIRQFVLEYTNTEPLLACEYLEHGPLIFVAYYIREAGALANYLLVVDTDGRLHLHEQLDRHLQQVGLYTFLIARDKLLLIKEKKQLVSYALPHL